MEDSGGKNGSGISELIGAIGTGISGIASGVTKIFVASKSEKVTSDRYRGVDDNPTYDGTAANVIGIVVAAVIILVLIIIIRRK